MDIARPIDKRKNQRRILYAIGGLALLGLITAGLQRLEPAPLSLSRSAVLLDTVKRGPMLRMVRGMGSLVPEEIRSLTSETDGRVEQILVRPGAWVEAETVLLELSNPTVEQNALDAGLSLKASEAELINLTYQLEGQRLTQESIMASAQADYNQSNLEAEVNRILSKDGLVPLMTLKLSQSRADELATRVQIEKKRLDFLPRAAQAQIDAKRAQVDQLRSLYHLKSNQVQALKIRAGTPGVLQQLGTAAAPLEIGQRISPGTSLARVADPARLKAEIRINETQIKDILLGQSAVIDTRNGTIPGRVSRIDPGVTQTTVTVDVTLEGPLPKGARPDLTVEGTIELERLDNVLYVGRPVYAREKSVVQIFRLVDEGKYAVRSPVTLGRTSVHFVEVVEGLRAGDQIIVSDPSSWDEHDRIRLD